MNHGTLAAIAAEAYEHAAFSVHECEAIIKYVEVFQIIAFRGTEANALISDDGWLDVVRDARVLPWHDEDCGWVHYGFLKGGVLAAEFLADKLNRRLPIILTGHSLGGALALICAAKLERYGFSVREWVGFGSPKVQLTGKKYPFKQTNYRNGGDIVPLLPNLPFYRHNGDLVEVGRPEIPNVHDHAVIHYVECVK